MDYIVKYGQNLMDIAMQEFGSIEGLLTLAIDNNLSITSEITLGQILKIDTTKIINKKVVEYYQNNKVIVATAQVRQTAILPPTPTLDETNLIFDFDFEQTGKMAFSGGRVQAGEYPKIQSYTDRGLVLEQIGGASFCPALTPEGLYFDGIDDFMTLPNFLLKEVVIVCNNISLVDADVLLFNGNFEIAKYASGDMLDLVYNNEIRINNTANNSFLPKEIFKTVSFVKTSPDGLSGFELCGNNTFHWQGNIKRILLFDVARTEAQRTELQAYLAQKYSL